MNKIYIGADHAGFKMKEELIEFLKEEGYQIEDKGAYELNPEDDYPDFVISVAKEVSQDPESMGIVIGGSGQGEAICSNRFSGIRAVVFNGQYEGAPDEISLSREHNNANILSLGARFISIDEAKKSVRKWLNTQFSGDERHVRRLQKIESCK